MKPIYFHRIAYAQTALTIAFSNSCKNGRLGNRLVRYMSLAPVTLAWTSLGLVKNSLRIITNIAIAILNILGSLWDVKYQTDILSTLKVIFNNCAFLIFLSIKPISMIGVFNQGSIDIDDYTTDKYLELAKHINDKEVKLHYLVKVINQSSFENIIELTNKVKNKIAKCIFQVKEEKQQNVISEINDYSIRLYLMFTIMNKVTSEEEKENIEENMLNIWLSNNSETDFYNVKYRGYLELSRIAHEFRCNNKTNNKNDEITYIKKAREEANQIKNEGKRQAANNEIKEEERRLN